jgi:hypothetical protein
MFRFSVQLLSETFLILRRIQRDIIVNLHCFFHGNNAYRNAPECYVVRTLDVWLLTLCLIDALFSNTLNIRSFLSVSEKASQPRNIKDQVAASVCVLHDCFCNQRFSCVLLRKINVHHRVRVCTRVT